MQIILFLKSVFLSNRNFKTIRAEKQVYLKNLEKCAVHDKKLLEEIDFIKKGIETLNWIISSYQGLINQLYIFTVLIILIITITVIYFIY